MRIGAGRRRMRERRGDAQAPSKTVAVAARPLAGDERIAGANHAQVRLSPPRRLYVAIRQIGVAESGARRRCQRGQAEAGNGERDDHLDQGEAGRRTGRDSIRFFPQATRALKAN